jgi:hypothetical protein
MEQRYGDRVQNGFRSGGPAPRAQQRSPAGQPDRGQRHATYAARRHDRLADDADLSDISQWASAGRAHGGVCAAIDRVCRFVGIRRQMPPGLVAEVEATSVISADAATS